MAVIDQVITDRYALYLGDCIETLPLLPADSIPLSVYSPPFAGLYHYSSSARDLSNCDSYAEFFEHYGYVIRELHRVTMPGRMTAVHCADVPSGNTGHDHLIDFTGDIIRAHEKEGWQYVARYCIWKDALMVRNRTMAKSLAHKTIVEDAAYASNASADYVAVFRKPGQNAIPIEHPQGFTTYAGAEPIPNDLLRYRNWTGKQTENRLSHWIWQRYASCFWDDIRPGHVVPHPSEKGEDDEKHLHPLQLDIIERIITLWSNPGETVLSPFAGVGSELYVALQLGRKAVGVELKLAYWQVAVRNLQTIITPVHSDTLFSWAEAQ